MMRRVFMAGLSLALFLLLTPGVSAEIDLHPENIIMVDSGPVLNDYYQDLVVAPGGCYTQTYVDNIIDHIPGDSTWDSLVISNITYPGGSPKPALVFNTQGQQKTLQFCDPADVGVWHFKVKQMIVAHAGPVAPDTIKWQNEADMYVTFNQKAGVPSLTTYGLAVLIALLIFATAFVIRAKKATRHAG